MLTRNAMICGTSHKCHCVVGTINNEMSYLSGKAIVGLYRTDREIVPYGQEVFAN